MKFSFWDFLSTLLIVATVLVVVMVAIIFFDPDSSINPFPFPTVPATIAISSFTPSPVTLPATWTPTPKVVTTPSP